MTREVSPNGLKRRFFFVILPVHVRILIGALVADGDM